MKLYEITGEMMQAIEKYNSVTNDEELEALGKTLQDIQIAFNEKATAVGFHIVNLQADVNAIEMEIARLDEMRNRLKKQAEWFKNYLHTSMVQTNTPQVTTSTLKVALVKNPPKVIVDDETRIPEEYKRTRTEVFIDKQRILKEWKEQGVGVEGTRVVQEERVSIK